MKSSFLTGDWALITGASRGLGRDFAFLFARDGFNLVLVARSRVDLEAVSSEISEKYKVRIIVILKDLSLRSAPKQVFDELQKRSIKIDILVNNAGFGTYGFFSKSDMKEEVDMIEVNVVALTQLTRLFLPGMISRCKGKIVNVASTAAFQPGPLMAVYCATKAGLHSFTQSLRHQLKDTSIKVFEIAPPLVDTDFDKASQEKRQMKGIPASQCAQEAIAGIEKDELEIAVGDAAKLRSNAITNFNTVFNMLNRQWE